MTCDKLIQEEEKMGSETEAQYISGTEHKGGEGNSWDQSYVLHREETPSVPAMRFWGLMFWELSHKDPSSLLFSPLFS